MCVVLMSNRAGLKHEFAHVEAHFTFDRGSLMKT